MSQYKVPQNVEAEDHILGPLTFKQFIYGCIGFGWAIVCFGLFKDIPALMFVVGFPPTLLFLLLAFYTRDGQNFEQILLAMVGFFASERRRLWVKEAVAVTFEVEPAKIISETTQRNPAEVRSQLERLSNLIDSRGWNLDPRSDHSEMQQFLPTTSHSDRLVAPPPAVPQPDEPRADMLDLTNSPLAQNLAQLLADAAGEAKSQAIDSIGANPRRARELSTSGVTPGAQADILRLATEGGDLTVARLAAQANRVNRDAS